MNAKVEKNISLITSVALCDKIAETLRRGEKVTIVIGGQQMNITEANSLAWGDNDGGWDFKLEK